MRHINRRICSALDEHHQYTAEVVTGQHDGTVTRTVHQFLITRHAEAAGLVSGPASYVTFYAVPLQDRLDVGSVAHFGLAASAMAQKHDGKDGKRYEEFSHPVHLNVSVERLLSLPRKGFAYNSPLRPSRMSTNGDSGIVRNATLQVNSYNSRPPIQVAHRPREFR